MFCPCCERHAALIFSLSHPQCKKKHTLVCQDFLKTGSCPRRAQCKLQHHHRGHKRSAVSASSSSTAAKRARTKEPCKRSGQPVAIRQPLDTSEIIKCVVFPFRPQLSVVVVRGSPETPETPATTAKGPLKLPSFISLSSSPEEADAPDTPGDHGPRVTGKPKIQLNRLWRGLSGTRGRSRLESAPSLAGLLLSISRTWLEGASHKANQTSFTAFT